MKRLESIPDLAGKGDKIYKVSELPVTNAIATITVIDHDFPLPSHQTQVVIYYEITDH
jgi:hypothetical protein